MNYYRGKKVFITGGSSGIGRCMALQVAQAGGDVAIAARGQEKLDAVLAELNETSDGNHHAFSVDVSDADAVRIAAEDVIAALGGIDVIINSAGVAHAGYVEEIPDDAFRKMMDINYFGVVNVCRAFIPALRAQQSGHIHIVGSVVSWLPVFGYTPYAPSKAAVASFGEVIRQELRSDNIAVSMSYPADTDTPQWHYENELKPGETKFMAGTMDLSQPEDIAAILLRGIAKGKLHITPGAFNKIARWGQHQIPFFVRWVEHMLVWLYRRKNPADAPQTHEA